MDIRLYTGAAVPPLYMASNTTVDGMTVTWDCSAAVHTVTLTAHRPGVCPEALEVTFPLPEELLTPAEALYYYDDSAHTNDFTEVHHYPAASDREIAQMALFKNRENGLPLLAGLLTLHRFWSSIRLHDGCVTFRFELEGRELAVDEPYIMERFMFAIGAPGAEFALLGVYADRIAELNHAVPAKEIPVGWCSWSCYFSDVNEEKLRRAADAQAAYGKGYANLIQIDDGWQKNTSFCGDWYADERKFPSGLEATSQYVRDRGMTFGLWLAPLLLSEKTPAYETMKDMAMEAVTLREHYHPFNLGDPRFHDHLRATFRRLVEDYRVGYFKLDFLAAAIRYFHGGGTFVHFEGGYCVELLRNALQTIRDTVGPDVFLLSCGAPTLIGAGIFNGARTSADIIWGKSKQNPTYWSIMKRCMATVGRRYFYHNKVYMNDPDGVVLRDYDQGDGFNCSWAEAELWSVAVAMSGGLVLSNDELENLSPRRRRLYEHLLPAIGVAARPVDYFETPYPTSYVLEIDGSTKFLALYNLSDEMADLDFDLSRIGMAGAYAADCLTGEKRGEQDALHIPNVNPHGAVMFVLTRDAGVYEHLDHEKNIFMGISPSGESYHA